MTRKIVLRTCVATGEQLAKKDLLRIVRTPDKEVKIDPTGKANGRGAYLKRSVEAIEIARKKNSLKRALNIEIEETLYDELIDYVTSK